MMEIIDPRQVGQESGNSLQKERRKSLSSSGIQGFCLLNTVSRWDDLCKRPRACAPIPTPDTVVERSVAVHSSPSSSTTVKPVEQVYHILVLSWQLGKRHIFAQCDHFYPFDKEPDFWYCWTCWFFYFSLVVIVPPAASSSRAKHANSTVPPVRSPTDKSHKTPTTRSQSQRGLQARPLSSQCFPFAFLCPEDFGGLGFHGPASPWSLAELQRLNGINEVWRGAAFMCHFASTDQQNPTGVPTNIQGLSRSLYARWPQLKYIDGAFRSLGPLLRVCPCISQHHQSSVSSSGVLNSFSSFSLSSGFWRSLFRDV